ncbi:MAG: ABC transporter substrate-binding protein [Clostridia bacterium]|nr:ABC transporter substrate-binding protein [Clostridia bacterium]
MRRLLCIVLALSCLLTVVGCTSGSDVSEPLTSDGDSPTPQDAPQTFAIPYSKEDTLNPYAATTEVNLNLASLLYDSLTVIDDTFTPRLSLAASVTATDATHLAVTLREGAVFSDGSAVTAADVKASYDAARAAENYQKLVSNVIAATVDRKSGGIVFTLAKGDPNAAACLSFPIYKATADTAAVGEAPVGGGAYVYTVGENGAYLAANPRAKGEPKYATVPLRHLPNSDSMYYGLASGNITYYYNDLNTGEVPRVSGASAKVDMNALVYLGVNGARESLANPTVRRALSKLTDRDALAYTGFAGWATAATLPFHPKWSGVQGIDPIFGKQELADAVELLKTAGQSKLELELIYSIDSGNRGTLVDTVRTQLESAGLRVTVTPLSYAEYLARLQSGEYDLYIGEIRLTANMDLDAFFDGGDARYGIRADSPAAEAYRRYRSGEGTVQEFITAFGEDMPYIPLCWRCGFAAYDRRLLSVTPHGYDPYYGFTAWH